MVTQERSLNFGQDVVDSLLRSKCQRSSSSVVLVVYRSQVANPIVYPIYFKTMTTAFHAMELVNCVALLGLTPP